MMKLRLAMPPAVIDIGRIPELRGISRSGDTIRIGALTTHAELAVSADLQKSAAALAEAAALVGDPAVRSRGTIGGNIAHADPASDLPTVLVALDARITAIGPKGTRTISAEDFFTGIMSTALAEDEVVSEIVVPASTRGQGSAYVKFSHPASRYAVVGAAALVSMRRISGRRAHRGRRPAPHATRARAVETALVGKPGTAATIEAAAAQLHADLGDQVSGDITRPLNTAPRCHRSTSSARWPRQSRAPASRDPGPGSAPASVDALQQALAGEQYIAERALAVPIYLALRLKRPLFLEGEAGVGKTEVAEALAAALQTSLIRLQCYEGLDVSHAGVRMELSASAAGDQVAGDDRPISIGPRSLASSSPRHS